MKLYTLTEASASLGMCRQTLSKKIKHYQIKTSKKGNALLISEFEFLKLQKELLQKTRIKKRVKSKSQIKKDPSLTAFLLKQIEAQNQQIETLQKSLDQQQQLQLLATQRVEVLEQKLLAAPEVSSPAPSGFKGILRRFLRD